MNEKPEDITDELDRLRHEIACLRYDRRWLLHHIALLEHNDRLCSEVIEIGQPYLQILRDEVRREQKQS